MEKDRMLTVAIHTYEKALQLKALLEGEGINVVLNNVNLSEPTVSSGIRVRIHEHDLPLALRIIENSEIFITPEPAVEADADREILAPVDFSPYSNRACKLAFDIASLHGAKITLLHAYTVPERINIPLAPTISIDPDDTGDPHLAIELEKAARERIDRFAQSLREQIKSGELPPVKFTTRIEASVPEDAINNYAKEHKPMIIIMGTRGADVKERDLIGSVTAEVLDSSRQPVFTVPDKSAITSVGCIHRVCVPCNLDQDDILAIDAFRRILPGSTPEFRLVNIERRRSSSSSEASRLLLEYCRTHYPTCKFFFESISTDFATEYFNRLDEEDHDGTVILIPNKKKNILSRLFNPSLAHKLLFHADIPLMTVPV